MSFLVGALDEACRGLRGSSFTQIPRRISWDDLGGSPEKQNRRSYSQTLEFHSKFLLFFTEFLQLQNNTTTLQRFFFIYQNI
jgi:hypothetical protein